MWTRFAQVLMLFTNMLKKCFRKLLLKELQQFEVTYVTRNIHFMYVLSRFYVVHISFYGIINLTDHSDWNDQLNIKTMFFFS